jgi:hypothetical protein
LLYSTPRTGMNGFRQRRTWFWIAIAAIVIVLLALLVPHSHSNAQPDLLALLPIFFVGVIAPLILTPLASSLCLGHASDGPALAPLFERPPPSRT